MASFEQGSQVDNIGIRRNLRLCKSSCDLVVCLVGFAVRRSAMIHRKTCSALES